MTLQFEKLHVLSAYQVVSRELRRLIVSGELKAGETRRSGAIALSGGPAGA